MSRVGLVIFDLDGTLVDASEDLADAANELLSRLKPGFVPLPLSRVRGFVGEGASRLVEQCLAAAGLPPNPEALSVYLECYKARLLRKTFVYPGVERALASLSFLPLAVLTNKPGDLTRELLKGLGIARCFASVYGGGDVPTRKPSPEGLLKLAHEHGVTPDRVLMVGDSSIDVRTGRNAGALTAGVLWGFDPEGVRAERPDYTLQDAGEIPSLVQALG